MTAALSIVDASGAAAGEVALPSDCLEREKGEQAVHDTVVSYLASLRSGSACTKNRTAVRGGGRKPWRQKGTGRARAGSTSSPIWRGGGVIFGPTPRRYDKKVNRKVRRLALRRAFTQRVDAGDVLVLDQLSLSAPKTREMVNILRAIQAGEDVLLVVKSIRENLNVYLATRNLPRLSLMRASSVNTYQILLHRKVVFTRDGLEAFTARLRDGAGQEQAQEEEA